MIQLYLKTLQLFRPVFRHLGVDFEQLVALVEVKLKMDNRRPRYNQMQQQTNESNSSLWFTMLLLSFFSVFMALIIYGSQSLLYPFAICFTYIMFMLGMTIITDFSSVILESADNAILLPRPMSYRTLIVARIVHITIYLFSLLLALVLPIFVAIVSKYGIAAAFIFFINSVLLLILVLILCNLLYMLLMKFTSEERLKNYINFVQIGFVITLTVGYQLIARLFTFENITDTAYTATVWWHYLLPPFWMAHSMTAFIGSSILLGHVGFILLIVAIPFGGAILFKNKALAQVFGEKIASMDLVGQPEPTKAKQHTFKYLNKLSQLFTGTEIERASFEFVWMISARDRKFKLRIYPGLAYVLIYPLIMLQGIGSKGGSWEQKIEYIQNGTYSMLVLIYLCLVSIVTVYSQLGLSDEYRAAWVFEASPIAQPGQILSGAFKAVLAKFILPILFICSIVVFGIWGFTFLDDLLFASIAIINLNLLIGLGTNQNLPFALPIKTDKGANFSIMIGYLIISFLIAGFHYFLMKVPYVILVFTALLFILMCFLFKKYRELGWEKISWH